MALPITLGNGQVLVYGWGYETSQSGIIPTTTGVKFGSIYQIWDGGAIFVYAGDPIMWKEEDVYSKLTYQGNPYTILPVRFVTKEILPP